MSLYYHSLNDYLSHEPNLVSTSLPIYTRTDLCDNGFTKTININPVDENGNRLDKIPQLVDTFMKLFGFELQKEDKKMSTTDIKKGITVSEPKMVKVNRHYGLDDIAKTFYAMEWVEDKEDRNWVLTTVVIFKDNRKVIVKNHVKDVVCVEIVEVEDGVKKILPTEESKEIGLAYAILKANEGALVEASTDNQIVGNGYMTKLKRIVDKAEVNLKKSEKAKTVTIVNKDTIKKITPNDVKETKVTPKKKPVSKNKNKKNSKQDTNKKLITE